MGKYKIGLSNDGDIMIVEDLMYDHYFRNVSRIRETSVESYPSRMCKTDDFADYNLKELSEEEYNYLFSNFIGGIHYYAESILELSKEELEENPKCFITYIRQNIEVEIFNDINLYQKKSLRRYDHIKLWYWQTSKESFITDTPHEECEECVDWEPISQKAYDFIEFFVMNSLKHMYGSLKMLYRLK